MSESMSSVLLKGSPWLRFMAVLTLLSAGLILVLSFVILGQGEASTGVTFGVFLFYAFLAGINLYLGLTLLSAGRAQKRAALEESLKVLEEALGYHARYWRALGMLTLVTLSLAVVGIAAAILIPMVLGRG